MRCWKSDIEASTGTTLLFEVWKEYVFNSIYVQQKA
jgi:hypothetical protein